MEMTSGVAPVGGNYRLVDCSTSLPAFSQRGKNSLLPTPTSLPDYALPCFLLDQHYPLF